MISKGKKKKVKKVIKGLKKASRTHAGQAKTLQRIIKKSKRNMHG
tara:strand:+ start:283 stop:417 length:135 start_codon:yes stop_codon:yes gene_type:complete